MSAAYKAAGISYNRLLAISGRVLRRSLKEDKRIQAERRGESELRVAFWKNGKQSEAKPIDQVTKEAAQPSA
ncbi:uncharacterized protein K489DRAFT_406082 [Dissoconium aciculare CBS 342.82]|uniref:Mitochondrial ATP synthase epsilon chain domain-containing protein n=1 Tax=Dissoconium aciculare CBS 342.82 TaxID=1314786 RepID=A0A6J3MHF4_9PEZI|nr:uncharacterized protein K489DRAFT_406082 [Dissoconium aciculare CBS 342.82]KAF1827381.1 hypothetical protein K489DRAFT_406082 [Dissoconium aciculare CBS 342.82]